MKFESVHHRYYCGTRVDPGLWMQSRWREIRMIRVLLAEWRSIRVGELATHKWWNPSALLARENSLSLSHRVLNSLMSSTRGETQSDMCNFPIHDFARISPASWFRIISLLLDMKTMEDIKGNLKGRGVEVDQERDDYREPKIRRNMLTTNPMQGQVRCCHIWGRRRKREENHMSGP